MAMWFRRFGAGLVNVVEICHRSFCDLDGREGTHFWFPKGPRNIFWEIILSGWVGGPREKPGPQEILTILTFLEFFTFY